jgi:hypothetical protein
MFANSSLPYRLTLREVENLFQVWVEGLKESGKEEEDGRFLVEGFEFVERPVPYYEKLFRSVFM